MWHSLAMTIEEKHQHWSEAAKRRHADPASKARVAARQRAAALKKDLALLGRVMGLVRRRIEFSAKNRAQALAAYYRKREAYNAARRTAKPLEAAFRRVLREQEGRKATLFRAAKRMLGSRCPEERKLRRAICRRFQKAFKNRHLSAYVLQLCGCTLQELRLYLERRFLPGMTWNNYGLRGWHIDHVQPIASFILRDPAQVARCFHWSNLQPLWAADNLKKGAVTKTDQFL